MVVNPDTTSPGVAVNVWYRVGSADEEAGHFGFAHLFEHLMFSARRAASHQANIWQRSSRWVGQQMRRPASTAPIISRPYRPERWNSHCG
ncbi:zinc protease [Cutibacterium acnes JCM 18909]|nr:zinc protease [Cutibacterium acnes JCM 18909]